MLNNATFIRVLAYVCMYVCRLLCIHYSQHVFNRIKGGILCFPNIKYCCIMKACYFSSVGREMRLYACDESQLLDRQGNHLPGQFYLARIFAHSGHTKSDQGRLQRRERKKSETESKHPSDAHIHPHDSAPKLLFPTDN